MTAELAELDNALVAQKNHILAIINNGDLVHALDMIAFTEPVWIAAGYGYKIREMRDRVKEQANHLMLNAKHWKIEAKYKQIYDLVG